MRRLIYLLVLAVFVGASVSLVSASTDCERWFVAYRQELAHSRHLQRVAAAQRRAKLYAKRKLAGYVKPAPKPRPAVVHSPRMTPRQTLHHFDLACGVLPESEEDTPKIAEEIPGEFSPERPLGDGVDLVPAALGDMVAENVVPPPPFDTGSPAGPGGPGVVLPPVGGGYGYPGGGSLPPGSPAHPGTPSTPGTPGTPGAPGTPGTPGTPGVPSSPTLPPGLPSGPPAPPPPPPAVVPEPASYVLMITGLIGAAGVIRRRFHA